MEIDPAESAQITAANWYRLSRRHYYYSMDTHEHIVHAPGLFVNTKYTWLLRSRTRTFLALLFERFLHLIQRGIVGEKSNKYA